MKRLPRPTNGLNLPGRNVRQRAFTLMEMVVVIMALGFVTMIAAAALYGTARTEQAEAAAFRRLSVQGILADQFRKDVAGAADAPDELGDVTAGPGCLILRRPDGGHVIYERDGDRVVRSQIASVGASKRVMPVGGERAVVEFLPAGAGGRLLTLRIIETTGTRSAAPSRVLDISAALGGDLR